MARHRARSFNRRCLKKLFNYAPSKARPGFFVDEQSRTVWVNQDTATAGLVLTDKSGALIKGDVTSIKFYFWNAGKTPIRFEEDFLLSASKAKEQQPKKEIIISLVGDDSSRILDGSCFRQVDPDYNGFRLASIKKINYLWCFMS